MEISQTMETPSAVEQPPLYDKWVLWAHLPHDTDWSVTSYTKIMEVNTMLKKKLMVMKKKILQLKIKTMKIMKY